MNTYKLKTPEGTKKIEGDYIIALTDKQIEVVSAPSPVYVIASLYAAVASEYDRQGYEDKTVDLLISGMLFAHIRSLANHVGTVRFDSILKGALMPYFEGVGKEDD